MDEMKTKALSYILKQLKMISSLHLPYSPKAEEIAQTAEVWLTVLTKKQGGLWVQGDGQRLKIGFEELLGDIDTWPAPKNLLDKMPPRKQRMAIPYEPRTEETDEEGLAKIREIMKTLNSNMETID